MRRNVSLLILTPKGQTENLQRAGWMGARSPEPRKGRAGESPGLLTAVLSRFLTEMLVGVRVPVRTHWLYAPPKLLKPLARWPYVRHFIIAPCVVTGSCGLLTL